MTHERVQLELLGPVADPLALAVDTSFATSI